MATIANLRAGASWRRMLGGVVRAILTVAAVGLVLLGEARDAKACTCLPSEVVWPAVGASNVPVNVRPVVSLAEGNTIDFRRAFNGPIVSGQTTKLGRYGRADAWRFVPDEDLEPNTNYVLEESGTVWFTTGDDRDEEAPMFSGATSVRIESMAERFQCHGGVCVEYRGGWHSRIQLEAEPTGDAAYYTLEFLDERGAVTDAIVSGWIPEASTSTCGTRPPALPPGERVCVRVIAYDLAGNQAGNDAPICEETIHCETLYKDEHCTMRLAQCEPAGCCGAGGGSTGNLSLLVVVAGLLLRRRRERTKRGRRTPVIATVVLHVCLFGPVLGCAGPDGDGPLNNPPTARFKATLTIDPLIGRLDATRTFEPDGDAVAYAWTVTPPAGVDAPVLDIDGPLVAVVASAPGRYQVELVATDEHGASSTASHALHLFDAAFPAVSQTPPFGNPVYAWSTRKLYFAGGTPGVLDVPRGVLVTDALQGSVSGFAVAPNGRGVLVMPLGGSVTYYDSMTGLVLGASPAGGTVAADDAIYWTSNSSEGVGLAKYDLDQQQVFIAGPSTEYEHPPIVSTALAGVIVPIGTWDSVERFEIYDLGSPPALVATIAASVPWGRVDALDGGDRIVVPGGPVYRISLASLEVLAAFGDDYRALAHNPTIGAFAVLNSLRMRVYSDQTFELLADYDLAGAIGSVGWQRIFRHERGFMVVQTSGASIHSLYVEP